MEETIQGALIGAVAAVICMVVGGIYQRWSAHDLLFQQAKADFTTPFVDAIIKLHTRDRGEPDAGTLEILQAGYPLQFAAYLKLRAVAGKCQVRIINCAWEQYVGKKKYELLEEAEIYRFSHVLNSESDEDQRLLAIKHINRLLRAIET